MDTVLTASRPALSEADAIELARSCFAVTAATARDLGSERDRTFALDDGAGGPVAILKVSNASEDPAVLDMEAEVVLHVMAADPGLRVARPVAPGPEPGRRRAEAADPEPARPGAAWRRGGRPAGPLVPRRRRPLGPALRRPARAQPDRGGAAERCRPHRLGRDDGPARPGAARLHPPPGAPHDAVGRPARPRLPGDARRHPRPAAARAGGARPGRVRADGHPGVAAAARPGRPHRPLGRQHRDRRRGVHHRDHRLRRHEPHGPDDRAGVGARLAGGRPRGRRALPPGPARPRRLPAPHGARGRRA